VFTSLIGLFDDTPSLDHRGLDPLLIKRTLQQRQVMNDGSWNVVNFEAERRLFHHHVHYLFVLL
jgi:hypothetical protein